MSTGQDAGIDVAGQIALRLGYLAIVQGVVTRLANSAATMKGASAAVMCAMLAFSVSQTVAFHWALFLPGGGVFLLFHAYFLQQERAFRVLYNEAASRPLAEVVSMKIDAQRLAAARESLLSVLCRPTVWAFHLFLVVGVTVTYLFARGEVRCYWT